jgi:hypothetical protein
MSDYDVFDYQKRKSELSPSFDFALPAAVSGSGVTGSVLLTAPYLQSRITATVGIEDAASTFGSLTLTVEASDDSETWIHARDVGGGGARAVAAESDVVGRVTRFAAAWASGPFGLCPVFG